LAEGCTADGFAATGLGTVLLAATGLAEAAADRVLGAIGAAGTRGAFGSFVFAFAMPLTMFG
jgi:hypothetical protein